LYLLPVGMLVYFGGRGHGGKRWFFLWATVAAVAVLLSLAWPTLAAQRVTFQTLYSTIQHECLNLRTKGITQTNHEPIWYYAVALPVATLPYSLFVPLAFARQYASGASPRQKRLLLLAACWLGGTVVLFTLCSPARKLRYVLPVFPAVALLAGDVMVRGVGETLRPWINRYVRFVGALLVYLLCLACACKKVRQPRNRSIVLIEAQNGQDSTYHTRGLLIYGTASQASASERAFKRPASEAV